MMMTKIEALIPPENGMRQIILFVLDGRKFIGVRSGHFLVVRDRMF